MKAHICLTIIAAGFISAQPARHAGGHMLQNLGAELNLIADQRAQARAIFSEGRNQNHDLALKLREQRAAMSAAVKNGQNDQIDKNAQESAPLRAQLEAGRAKTMSKFYAILTPEQRTKFDAKHDTSLKPRRRALKN